MITFNGSISSSLFSQVVDQVWKLTEDNMLTDKVVKL